MKIDFPSSPERVIKLLPSQLKAPNDFSKKPLTEAQPQRLNLNASGCGLSTTEDELDT